MVYIPGTAGNDTLTGSVLDDVIEGFGGFDVISAAAGNDSVSALAGGDIIFGNAGNDTIDVNFFGATSPSTIYGGSDNDYIEATLGNDTVYGDLGSDTIIGVSGNDLLIGTNVNNDQLNDLGDRIIGEAGNDVIYGNTGNDTLFGDSTGTLGNDTLYGGRDNDLVLGDSGDDYLYGNLGNDTIRGFVPGGTLLPYGVNYMTGNDGNDSFRTSSDAAFTASSLDYILDFTGNGNASTGDSLNFNSTSIGSGFTIIQLVSGSDLVLRVTKPNGYQDDFAVLVGRSDLAGILPIGITSLMSSPPSIASASSLDIAGIEEQFIKAIALKQDGKSIASLGLDDSATVADLQDVLSDLQAHKKAPAATAALLEEAAKTTEATKKAAGTYVEGKSPIDKVFETPPNLLIDGTPEPETPSESASKPAPDLLLGGTLEPEAPAASAPKPVPDLLLDGEPIAEPAPSPIAPSDYPKFDLKSSYQNDLIVTSDGLVGRAITITETDYSSGKLNSVLPKWLTISFVEEAIVAEKSPIF